MSAFEVPCPQCGRKLKLADRALLGRKARCGACGHRFILEDPDSRKRSTAEQPPVRIEFASIDEPGRSQNDALAGRGGTAKSGEPSQAGPFPASPQSAVGPASLQVVSEPDPFPP